MAIPGLDEAVDIGILFRLAARSYGECTYNSEWAHLLVEETGTYLAFAYRGTNIRRLADLCTDLDAEATPLDGVADVDTGFYRSACSVFWMAIPRIVAAVVAGKKVYGTGHSKGGAEARQSTLMLLRLGIRPDRVSVWEPARSLSATAWAWLRSREVPGIGVRNGQDPIVGLPPKFADEELYHMQPGARAFDPIEHHFLVSVRAGLVSEGYSVPS